jgi:two-component system response regulator YesN
MKLGAFDFLLKPTKIEEITEVIKRTVTALDSEKHRKDEMQQFKELYEKNIPLIKEKLLFNLLYGIYLSESDVEEQIKRLDLQFDTFVMGIIDNESQGEKDSYALQLYQFGIISTLDEVLSRIFHLYPQP